MPWLLSDTNPVRFLSAPLDDAPRTFVAANQTRRVSEEHTNYKKLMESVQLALDVLLGGAGAGKSAADRASVLTGLKKGLATFGKGMLEHLDREEMYFADPVARKVGPAGGKGEAGGSTLVIGLASPESVSTA